MVPNVQNQHFAELRQIVCLYTHAVVLLRDVPSLEAKNEFFGGKKREKRLAHSCQTDYRSHIERQVISTSHMMKWMCTFKCEVYWIHVLEYLSRNTEILLLLNLLNILLEIPLL